MSKPSDSKPTTTPKPETTSKQPIAPELSPKELDQVAGGLHDLQIPKHVDKSSAKLF